MGPAGGEQASGEEMKPTGAYLLRERECRCCEGPAIGTQPVITGCYITQLFCKQYEAVSKGWVLYSDRC